LSRRNLLGCGRSTPSLIATSKRFAISFRAISGLALFAKANLAEKGESGRFKIKYRTFRVQQGEKESDDVFMERKLNHVKDGIIRALTKTEKPQAKRTRLVRPRKKAAADKNQTTLPGI
jgi:hypothetical protein